MFKENICLKSVLELNLDSRPKKAFLATAPVFCLITARTSHAEGRDLTYRP
jgi:hypothetical protein